MKEPVVSQNNTQEMQNSPSRKFPYTWLLILILIIGVAVVFFLLNPKKNSENNLTNNNGNKNKEANEYNWSQMNEGPYSDRISYAVSNDLLNWSDSGKILAQHASVPDVILKEGELFIYFVDVSEDGKPEQIGLLKSKDQGQTWEEKQIATIEGLGNKVAVDPAPFLLSDGRIRLYYFDIAPTKREGTSGNTIYSAISKDGIHFVEEDGYRFKYRDIFDPDVIQVGNTWRMYVGTGGQQVLSAISSDGLNFTYEGVALTEGSIPNVIFKDNQYYLFTGGIEILTSEDSQKFTKTNYRFDSGKLTADPGVVELDDGTYFMVYKTKEESFK